MKKFLMLAAAAVLLLGSLTARAGDSRPIDVTQLPERAQQFIRRHFPEREVSQAWAERERFGTTYEVRFADGAKVEFTKNGDWKEVECKPSAVPAAILPVPIAQYVARHYPGTAVVEIDRDRREYEVKLSSGVELTFDSKFNLTDTDD